MPAPLDMRDPDAMLERTQWDFFWAPPDTGVVDRDELAYLHVPRDVPMLNTVVRTRAPAARLPALVEEVAAAHREVTSRWLVPPTFDTRPLVRVLSRHGYRPVFLHAGFTVAVEAWRPRRDAGLSVRRVESLEVLRDCLAVADAAFGGAPARSEQELAHELADCVRPEGRVHRFVAYDATGRPVASGGMSVFAELGFGYLFAGATVPDARGRGAYSAVVAARLAQARRLGLARVGLYARVDTSAPIVERQGFVRHGPMSYWDRAAPGRQARDSGRVSSRRARGGGAGRGPA